MSVNWKKLGLRSATGLALTAYFGYVGAMVLPAFDPDKEPFKFPDAQTLNPSDAPTHTQRHINPLWAPTAYLQGIDCRADTYDVRLLDGTMSEFKEYTNIPEDIQKAADDSSLSFSVHVNDTGHAILLLKAMSLPQENDKHEKAIEGTFKDTFQREQQIPALSALADALLADANIKTLETVGFAQGSEGVYHLAHTRSILGTNISDTGTNYRSEQLARYVVSLDVPGDIHFLNSTGDFKPAVEIDLSDAVDWSLTPVPTSWVEKIQTYAFAFPEAQAPEGYEDQGIKLLRPNAVCNNSAMR